MLASQPRVIVGSSGLVKQSALWCHPAQPFEVAADAQCKGLGHLGKLGAGGGLYPMKAQRAIGALDIHPVEERHVEVDIEVQSAGSG